MANDMVGARRLRELDMQHSETIVNAQASMASLPEIPTDAKPDRDVMLNKIYTGRVTGMRDFGAFVQLDGVVPRREGMVHVSLISSLPHQRI